MKRRGLNKRIGVKLDEEINKFRQRLQTSQGKEVRYTDCSNALASILSQMDVVINIEKGKRKRKRETKGEFIIRM